MTGMHTASSETSFGLSPMQYGMLFHTLSAREQGVYLQQLRCGLRESLNVPAFMQAWDRVVERHGVLRTTFRLETSGGIKQDVLDDIETPFAHHDWRCLCEKDQEDALARYLRMDRARGFEFGKAPFMRLALFQIAEADYRLVWTSHHALMDGRSRLIVLNELFEFYEAFCEGRGLHLPEPRPYRDFIDWIERQDWSRAEIFWRRELSGFSAPVSLIRRRAAAGPVGFGEESLGLSAELTEALRSFANARGLTLHTLLQGAWAMLLCKYSGEADVVFGATRACRRTAFEGAGSMVGLLINTVPIRARALAGESLLSLLHRLRSLNLALREFEHTPLAKIQEWSELSKGTPLFETILVFENYRLGVLMQAQGGGLRHREFVLIERSNYPLAVLAYDGAELTIKIAYHRSQIEQPLAVQMIRHLEAALGMILTSHELAIGNLSLLSESDRRQILYEWNQTQFDYPKAACAHNLFEAQVERAPDSVALVFEGEQVTYAKLNECANQLARRLQKLGVGPEALVGIYLERSVELVVSILGVLKAAGAYAPLDPDYPQARLDAMIADSRLLALIAAKKRFGDVAPVAGPAVLYLDEESRQIAEEESTNPDSGATGANLAYVIYTSGSTGAPKAVMLAHGGLCNLSVAQIGAFEIGPGSRVLQFASPSFDASVSEIFTALSSGATLCMAKRERLALGESLTELLREEAITVVTAPPSMLASTRLDGLSGLRTIVSASEECAKDVAARCISSARRFLNAYGPTETTVCATISVCSEARQHASIGCPINNAQVYALGPQFDPAPAGIAGELYVGGAGLARGYLNQPSLTAEKFIPNPYSVEPGARLYKTGDLGRYLAGGDLEFLGRIDNQVKIRGIRVELSEIEDSLRQFAGVRNAVVIASETSPGPKRLIAYLTTSLERKPAVGEVRAFLKQKLPEYLIPASFVILESLPVSPNGKVNRRALPDPDRSRPQLLTEYLPPRTPMEEICAAIWSQALGVDRVGVNDDLFELGRNSLQATLVVSRVREILKLEAPLLSAIEASTVADFAERLESLSRQGEFMQAAPVLPVARGEESPPSFAQQRIWILDQLEGATSVYNVPLFLKLSGPLNVPALQDALSEIVRRHEVLRTTYLTQAGAPAQRIHPPGPLSMPLVELSELGPAAAARLAGDLAQQEAHRPFDLRTGPVFRTSLLRVARDQHTLLLTLHHIACDGWSAGIILDELSSFYNAYVRIETPHVGAMPIQYSDYSLWQRNWLKGETLKRQLDYWRGRLADAPAVFELHADYSRPAVQSYRGSTCRFSISAELASALREVSRQNGVTLFMTLLAAFKVLLFRYTGESDILVGTPIAGRARSEFERLIGLFVNTLVLRARVAADHRFTDLLAQVRAVCLEAYARQDVPFEKLVEELCQERSLSHAPLFQIMFSMLSDPESQLEMTAVKAARIEVERTTTKFDLSLSLIERKDGELRAALQYSADLFAPETIKSMGNRLRKLLEAIAGRPSQLLREAPLLDNDEREQQLITWNLNKVHEIVEAQCIHQMFEEQAAERPCQIALVYEEQHLSYAELNRRANQLARRLHLLGARPETLVGICIDRSIEMVIAALGALKAGAAYIPLDPSYPQARLEAIIAASGLLALITKEEHFRASAPATVPAIICLDEDEHWIAEQDSSNPESGVTADNLAYVIYTSGSTGSPKGVAIEHRSIANYVRGVSKTMMVEAGARFALVSTFAADLGLTMLFPSLCGGGALHLISNQRALDAAILSEYFQRNEINYLKIAPSHMRALIRSSPAGAQVTPRRLLVMGGEALQWDLIEMVEEQDSGCQIMNHYGPTETTVGVLTHTVESLARRFTATRTRTVALGRPLPNIETYALDCCLQPMPIGARGELYIGGDCLARGYLNCAELTAELFIPHPFSAALGGRLYSTRDLARYHPDGKLEFLGRRDDQVKVRGFRVELADVESALAKQQHVREAAVIAHDDGLGGKRLIAYVSAQQTSEIKVDELRKRLKMQLPEYMIPARIILTDHFPRTPNGKLNRTALKNLNSDEDPIDGKSDDPRTPTEAVVAGIFSAMLGVDSVGIDDDFFQLGGHSLMAMQVVSRIRETLLVELRLRDLFESPTVSRLSEAIISLEPKRGRTESIARLLIGASNQR